MIIVCIIFVRNLSQTNRYTRPGTNRPINRRRKNIIFIFYYNNNEHNLYIFKFKEIFERIIQNVFFLKFKYFKSHIFI